MEQDEMFCVGKTIAEIQLTSRGAWEGMTGTIVFTDGSYIIISDELNCFENG
jgi:hypothetical protein